MHEESSCIFFLSLAFESFILDIFICNMTSIFYTCMKQIFSRNLFNFQFLREAEYKKLSEDDIRSSVSVISN